MSSSRCASSVSSATAAEYAAHWPRSGKPARAARSAGLPSGSAGGLGTSDELGKPGKPGKIDHRCLPPPSRLGARGGSSGSGREVSAQLSLLPLFAAQHSVTADEIEQLRAQIQAHVRASRRGRGTQVALTLTNNRSTMISVRRSPGFYRLRLHRMFLGAGSATIGALGRYITDNDRVASAELGEFIEAHQDLLPPRPSVPARAPSLVPKGRYHNLQEVFDRLNRRYFGNSIEACITWGRMQRRNGRSRRHSTINLGSYSVEDRLIRIHPTLDQAGIPPFFVDWIVYHEMLHQKHPIPIVSGRRRFHTAAFLAEERLFDEYERAHQWERRNLHRLMIF